MLLLPPHYIRTVPRLGICTVPRGGLSLLPCADRLRERRAYEVFFCIAPQNKRSFVWSLNNEIDSWLSKEQKIRHTRLGGRCGQYSIPEFIDPDWGDKVNSGIGLLYRPARLHGVAGRYDNPMPELTLSPSH